MIQLTPQMRILVAVDPVDFRRGIDGLGRVCREVLASDPMSGIVFVFRNRRATAIRLLTYDGQGFWLCHNQRSSHYTSSAPIGASSVFFAWRLAARSTSRFHRLHCLTGGAGPGSS